ncbi:MAG: hypothetical protein HC854_04040 [Flavobacterium sp.]|nr:hypothetical protein [Flavobacterium sp.]
MDFDFIQELLVLLQTNNIFKMVITGSKTLAIVLLIFRFLDTTIRNMGEDNHKYLSLPTFVAYAFFIVTSDWIPNIIEDSFVSLDTAMAWTNNDIYTQLNDSLVEQWDSVMDGCEDWMDYIGVIASSITFVIFYIIAVLLASICSVADLSLTASYLLIRIFLIQLMKVIFPIIIAYSTLDITKDLLGKWIKRYTGLMLLGLAYLGIVNFTYLVQDALQKQFVLSNDFDTGTQLNHYAFGLIITIIVVFTVKVKLFRESTSFISNLFS